MKNKDVNKKSYHKIDYTTSWDDFQVINEALKINNEDTVITVTGSGDNTLNLLLSDPKEIISIDNNPYQNYLLKLKIVAINRLDYSNFLELMGVKTSDKRKEIYYNIRNNIDEKTRLFWDSNLEFIEGGIMYNGATEKYLKFYGKYIRFIKTKNKIEKLFTFNNIDEQINYFNKNINDFSFDLFYYTQYYKPVLKIKLCLRLINDFLKGSNLPEHNFEYIKNISYSRQILKNIKKQFTNSNLRNNNFVSLFLLGYYKTEECYPPYLKKENFDILKKRTKRIEIITKDFLDALDDMPKDSISKFNLSNLPDWICSKNFKILLDKIIRVGKNNSMFCYFSTRIDRELKGDVEFIRKQKEIAIKLLKKIFTWDYEHFEIGIIEK